MLQRLTSVGICLLLASACSHGPARAPQSAADVAPRVAKRFDDALAKIAVGDSGDAERMLLGLVADHPQLPGPHANLGIVYLRTDRLALAERSLRTAVSLKPDGAEAWNQLGIVLRKSGRFADAEVAYQSALDADPAHANANLNLGVLYDLYLAQPAKAVAYFERYRDLDGAAGVPVAKWIAEIERRVPAEARTAEAAQP